MSLAPLLSPPMSLRRLSLLPAPAAVALQALLILLSPHAACCSCLLPALAPPHAACSGLLPPPSACCSRTPRRTSAMHCLTQRWAERARVRSEWRLCHLGLSRRGRWRCCKDVVVGLNWAREAVGDVPEAPQQHVKPCTLHGSCRYLYDTMRYGVLAACCASAECCASVVPQHVQGVHLVLPLLEQLLQLCYPFIA